MLPCTILFLAFHTMNHCFQMTSSTSKVHVFILVLSLGTVKWVEGAEDRRAAHYFVTLPWMT